jgi:undecaprenyl diphosphate synthase
LRESTTIKDISQVKDNNYLNSGLDLKKRPKHIAIIMDGNGRWAKQRGLFRNMGHKEGVEALRRAIKACAELGIKYLSVYVFSTENWKRPETEIKFLMSLIKTFVKKELSRLKKEGIKVRALGNIEGLKADIAASIKHVEKETRTGNNLNLNLLLNYGARDEIIRACKKIIETIDKNNVNEIDDNLFAQHLYTQGMPDPELVIRTSGTNRISNFLLWQIAYSEIVIVQDYWPDFNKETLIQAIKQYEGVTRNFGALNYEKEHAR